MCIHSSRVEDSASRDILSRFRVGVWSIEFEKGAPPRMYGDATVMALLDVAGEPLSPEAFYRAWYDRIDPQQYDALMGCLDQMVCGGRAEIQYSWRHPARGVLRFRCTAMRSVSREGCTRLEGLLQEVTNLEHLPEAAARHDPPSGRREKRPVEAFASQGKVFSVVIVDDMSLNLRILETRFEHLGVDRSQIRSYENARDALAGVARQRPSLILTDMWMPGMNGEELAREIRKDEKLKGIPIVAETADVDASEAFDLSVFDAVLLKPLTHDKLREMFEKVFPS